MKICRCCGAEKDDALFCREPRNKDGLHAYCKSCQADKSRARRAALGPDYAAYKKRRREAMAEKMNAQARKLYAKDPEKHRRAQAEWRERNKVKCKAYAAEYVRSPRGRALQREHARKRRATPHGALKARISASFQRVLRSGKGGLRTECLVGYSMSELRTHLERQFTKGMSWDNMGEWHIDHIVPLSSFTISGPEDPELRRAWALTNLRPMWASENLRKKDKRTHLV